MLQRQSMYFKSAQALLDFQKKLCSVLLSAQPANGIVKDCAALGGKLRLVNITNGYAAIESTKIPSFSVVGQSRTYSDSGFIACCVTNCGETLNILIEKARDKHESIRGTFDDYPITGSVNVKYINFAITDPSLEEIRESSTYGSHFVSITKSYPHSDQELVFWAKLHQTYA